MRKTTVISAKTFKKSIRTFDEKTGNHSTTQIPEEEVKSKRKKSRPAKGPGK